MDVHMVLSDRGLIGTVGLSQEHFITLTGIAVQAQNPQP
jgi:hypothetical protein